MVLWMKITFFSRHLPGSGALVSSLVFLRKWWKLSCCFKLKVEQCFSSKSGFLGRSSEVECSHFELYWRLEYYLVMLYYVIASFRILYIISYFAPLIAQPLLKIMKSKTKLGPVIFRMGEHEWHFLPLSTAFSQVPCIKTLTLIGHPPVLPKLFYLFI